MFKPSIEPNELSSFLSPPSPPPPTEEPHFNHSPISHLLGAGAPSRRMRRRRRRRRRRWRKEKNKKTDDVHPRLLFFLPPPSAGNPFFELLKTISYHRRGIRHLGSDGGGGSPYGIQVTTEAVKKAIEVIEGDTRFIHVRMGVHFGPCMQTFRRLESGQCFCVHKLFNCHVRQSDSRKKIIFSFDKHFSPLCRHRQIH